MPRCARPATRQSLSNLATAVLRQHFAQPRLVRWALNTLQALFGDRVPALGRLDTRLRHGQETQVYAAVRQWLRAGIDRRAYEALFAVTQALGRRAWKLPGLQEMLAGAIDPGNVSPVVQRAINLWLADPSTRSLRVEHVIRVDPSTLAPGHAHSSRMCRSTIVDNLHPWRTMIIDMQDHNWGLSTRSA